VFGLSLYTNENDLRDVFSRYGRIDNVNVVIDQKVSNYMKFTFQLDPPRSRCLGVFGLSLHTNENDIRSVFSRYGRIETINVVIDQKVSCIILITTSEQKLP